MHAHVHEEFFRNQDVSPSPRLFFSFYFSHRGWPVSRGRSYIIHPRGVATGVVAKNLAEQKLSSVLGQSELNAFSLLLHLLLSLLLFLLLLLLSIRFAFTSPSSLRSFVYSLALSPVSGKDRKKQNLCASRKRLDPSSLGFQGLLLAAFNERKDKAYPPSPLTFWSEFDGSWNPFLRFNLAENWSKKFPRYG